MIGAHGRFAWVSACVLFAVTTGCIPAPAPAPGVSTAGPAPGGVPESGPASAGAPSATPSEATSAAQPEPTTKAIPVYFVPRAAEPVVAFLDGLDALLATAPLAQEVQRELPRIDATLQPLGEQQSPESLANASGGDLTDWRQEYARQDSHLESLESRLEERAGDIQDRLKDIGGLIEQWEKTRVIAVAEAAPEPILHLIEDIQLRLETTRDRIRTSQSVLLGLLAEIAGRRMAVAAALRDLDTALKADQERLFRVESASLFQALSQPPHRLGLTGEFLDAWRENTRSLTRFASESAAHLLLHAGIFIVFLVVLVLVGPVVRRRAAEDQALADAAWVIGRPVSAALLLALILTFWLYPLVPRSVIRAAMLLMFVPLVRLLPGLVTTRLLPGLRVLAVLYLLDRITSFASPHSLLLRILLLTVTLVAALLLAWELRAAGSLGRVQGPRRRRTLLAGWASFGLLMTSAAANLVGNVSLAGLLTRGVLIASYGALAFYAAARILEGLWMAILSSRGARRFRLVTRHGETLRRRGVRIIGAVAFIVWGGLVLRLFGLFGPLTEGVLILLRTNWRLGDLTLSLGSIVLFIVMLVVAVALGRLLKFVLDEGVLPYLTLPRGVPTAISVSAQYVVIGSGLLLAISASGVAMDRFTFLAGALGVGIGFGLQNVVNNFVSGLILLYERPVQHGDIVEVGPLLGVVRRIGVRSSTVRTYDGAEVIVPNAHLISEEVVNWTLSDQTRRVEIKLGVAYGTDPALVLDLLKSTVRNLPGVLAAPEPVALFEGFGDSSLDFAVRFWTSEFDRWVQLRSEVRAAIYKAVCAAGIEIPFPQRDLHLKAEVSDSTVPTPLRSPRGETPAVEE